MHYGAKPRTSVDAVVLVLSSLQHIRERDAEVYRQLEATGFMLDFDDDNSGLFIKYLRGALAYYVDVGAKQHGD